MRRALDSICSRYFSYLGLTSEDCTLSEKAHELASERDRKRRQALLTEENRVQSQQKKTQEAREARAQRQSHDKSTQYDAEEDGRRRRARSSTATESEEDFGLDGRRL